MYNVFYKGKILTRVYRKDVYCAQFIQDEIKKVIDNYSKYYSENYDVKDISIKTESGQDITEHIFLTTNLFLSSDLDFLNEYKI